MKNSFALRSFLLGSSLFASASSIQAQTNYQWNGTTNGTFATTTNWSSSTVMPFNGTSNSRLNVNNTDITRPLTYSAAQGTTIYSGGAGRALVIASGTAGSMVITGGTFDSRQTTEDALVNGAVAGSLTINGGTYINTNGGSDTFLMGLNAGGTPGAAPTLNIESGNFTSGRLQFGQNSGIGAGGIVGVINLNGGILSTKQFHEQGSLNNFGDTGIALITSTVNFNGGTLRALETGTIMKVNAVDNAIVQSGGAIIDTNTFNTTIAKALTAGSPSGGLTKQGVGSLTLSGTNTYTGATAINAGTLSAATIVVSGGSSNLGNASSAVTLGSAGAEGTLSYTGATATYTRGFTIGGAGNGRLDVTTAATTLSVDTAAITGTGLFTIGGSGRATINAAITHTGGLTKAASSGTLTLSNSTNSYTGTTTISEGALIVTANNALGGTAGGTTVNTASALGLSGGIDYTALETVSGSGAGTGIISGIAAASRGFIQSVSGNNTFRGNITVNAGGVSRIGTQNGASLTLTGAITQASGSMFFRPGDSGGEYVTLSNSGNSFGGNSVIYTNATAGNYAGVRLGVDNALPTTLTILGEAGTNVGTALDLNGKIQTLNGLAGSTNLNIINSNTSTASTLTVDNLVDRITSGTLIRGGVGLGTINVIKDGAFTQTLSGTHDYTGTTDVSEGKLVINGNISTSTLTTVASGATLGGNATTGALTIASGGFVTPGNSPGILTVSGNYTQAGQYTAEIDGLTPGNLAGNHDQINVTGTVDITGGSLSTLFSTFTPANGNMIFLLLNDGGDAITGTYSGFAQGAVVSTYGGFDWQISYLANSGGTPTFTGGNDIALMAVPEPNAAALLGGLGMLALLRRRR